MKQAESHKHRILNRLRLEYEAVIPLHVKFVGRIEPETTAGVVPALIALKPRIRTARIPDCYRYKARIACARNEGLSIGMV